jgi:hypothetical protein
MLVCSEMDDKRSMHVYEVRPRKDKRGVRFGFAPIRRMLDVDK